MGGTRSVHGGLRLDAHKQRSTLVPLRPAGVSSQIVLPLDQHAGTPATPLIEPGDIVALGQPIAAASSDISAWLHSPVSGRVVAIEPRRAPHKADSVSIVIANDGEDRKHAANTPIDFRSLMPIALCEHLARGGIVGLGGAAFPTAAKLLRATASKRPHLLLNGAECEPWISCDEMLMRERAADIVFGAQVLCHVLNASRCTIAIEDNVPAARQALQAALATDTDAIALAMVPSVYPAGGERQLVASLTGREVPSDGLPSDIGVVCQNVGTAAATARWIRDGEPLISRIVSVTGSGVREPANLEVRIGTSIAQVVADCGGYTGDVQMLIMGGSMMGSALAGDDLPVLKATNCIIAATAADLQLRGPEMPCIRCGNCSDACPAALLPQQLHWYALDGDQPALARLGLLDCIECGCCDHVCPSQIPLTQRFRAAKPALLAARASRRQADAARIRFESREQRLVRLEQEQRDRLEEKRRQLTGRKT